MASTIVTKNSSTASAVPVSGDLTQGELAVNVTDKRLFTKNSGGTIVELGTNPASLALPNGTANGVAYLNGSKVVTTGSALTFDGTNFATTGRVTSGTGVFAGTNIILGNGGTQSNLYLDGGYGTYLTASINRGPIQFYVSDSEAMRLTSTGLGIGTSSPNYLATLYKTSLPVLQLANSTSGSTAGDGLLIYLNGANATISNEESGSIGFQTAGTLRATLDASGNLGLGVTPSAWDSTFKSLQVPGGAVSGYSPSQIQVIQNAYYNAGWKYTSTAAASRYGQDSGVHAWYNAPSGTAGNAITFTQAMTLDASGNLGIGTTSPTFAAGGGLQIKNSTFASCRISHSSYTGLDVSQASDGKGYLWNRDNADILFGTNNTERARIDSSGNLLVGTTAVVGSERLNVTANTGSYNARFVNANASPYGPLAKYSGATPNGTGNECWRFEDSSSLRFMVASNGGINNFSGNNVNLSDRREKTNFAPAGDYLAKICAIPVQTFNYIDQNMEDDPGLTLGVVAQDVEAVAPELVMESNWGTEEEPKMRLSIYQTDLQYALMKALQELKAEFDAYKATHP
jgi:hypothetical protein